MSRSDRRRPSRAWPCLAALVLMGCAGLASGASGTARIVFQEGPDASATLELTDRSVTLVEETSVDGAPFGVFRAALTRAELRTLRDRARTVEPSPAIPDAPTVLFDFGTLSKRLPLPPATPAEEALTRQVEPLRQRALAHPVAALRLSLSRGARGNVELVLESLGEAPLSLEFEGEAWLEHTPPRAPVQPGVTPLPPEWTRVSTVSLPATVRGLVRGRPWRQELQASGEASAEGAVRLRCEATVGWSGSGAPRRSKAHITSAPVSIR